MGITWKSHVHQMYNIDITAGYYMHVISISNGHHMDIIWAFSRLGITCMLYPYQMGITWISHEHSHDWVLHACYIHIKWASHEYHMGIHTTGYYMHVISISNGHHMNITWAFTWPTYLSFKLSNPLLFLLKSKSFFFLLKFPLFSFQSISFLLLPFCFFS